MKKIIFCCIFLPAVWASGFAATVGFSCVQNTDSPDALKITAALETALFDLAFDYGMIATSMEYSLKGYEYYKSNTVLRQLFELSADYLAVIYCGYENGSNTMQSPIVWKKLEFKLLDSSRHTILAEERIPLDNIQEHDSLQKARIAGKEIGLRILQHIQPQR